MKDFNKENFTYIMKKRKDFIEWILKLSTLVIGIFSSIYYYFYAIEAEKFYGVPKEYFFKAGLKLYVVFNLIIIFYLLFFVYPNTINKIINIHHLSLIESFAFSLVISLIFLSIILVVSYILYDLKVFSLDLNLILTAISILSTMIFIYYFLYFYLLRTKINIDKKSYRKTLSMKVNGDFNLDAELSIEEKEFDNVDITSKDNSHWIPIIVMLIVLFISYFSVSIIRQSINFTKKTTYEVAEIKTKDYYSDNESMLVVGKYRDYNILLKILDIRDGVPTFEKGSYNFERLDNLNLKIENFRRVRKRKNWFFFITK